MVEQTRPDLTEKQIARRTELAEECGRRWRRHTLDRVGVREVARCTDTTGPSEMRAALTRLAARLRIATDNNHALFGLMLMQAGMAPREAVHYLDLTHDQLDELLTMPRAVQEFLECAHADAQAEWFDRHPIERACGAVSRDAR